MKTPTMKNRPRSPRRIDAFAFAGVLVAALLALAGCGGGAAPSADQHDHDPEPDTAPPGKIALNAVARGNLGIVFAEVERRRVQSTLRMPGRFESEPRARAEYRALARGRVEPIAEQYQAVEKGDPLFRLDAAAWRELQSEMAEAELNASLLGEQLAAQADAVAAARMALAVWEERAEKLEALAAAGAPQASQLAEARGELASARASLAEELGKERELRAQSLATRDESDGSNPAFDIALRNAAALMGCEESWLLESVDGKARWKTLRSIEVRARQAGVVSMVEVAPGGLAEENALVMATLDPAAIRFRAFGLQADLPLLYDGQTASVAPAQGGIAPLGEAIPATLLLGVEADAEERTIDVIGKPDFPDGAPDWARPGVVAFLEVAVAGSEDPELAIPLSAVVTDELDRVFFLRDRENPDQVVRVAGDFGADDGRWIVVNSGVRQGDEVVLEGAYELKLAGGGKEAKGGHFHADGTFHAEAH